MEKQLRAWQENFSEKYGAEQCIVYTPDSITLPHLKDALQWWGLFSTKKLIICKWIPDDKWAGKTPAAIIEFFEYLLKEPERIFSPDVILIFASVDPDKRVKLYKLLAEKATVKGYEIAKEKELIWFLQERLGEYFTQELATYLLTYVGTNMFRLEQECEKITAYLTYTGRKDLSDEEQERIIYTPLANNNFDVLDALVAGNTQQAISLLDTASASQVARPEFLGMMYWWLKHIIQTVDLYKAGITSSKEIGAEIGIHPYPISKNLTHIRYLITQQDAFIDMFHECIILDKKIKSGLFPQEWFFAAMKQMIWWIGNEL